MHPFAITTDIKLFYMCNYDCLIKIKAAVDPTDGNQGDGHSLASHRPPLIGCLFLHMTRHTAPCRRGAATDGKIQPLFGLFH